MHDTYAAELVPQHHDRALDARMQVDVGVGGRVHVRVLLHRRDKRGDASRGVLDLVHQGFGLHRVADPPQRRLDRLVADGRGGLVDPGGVEAGRDQHLGKVVGALDAEPLQAVDELILGIGALHRRQCGPLGGARCDGALLQLDELDDRGPVEVGGGDHAQLVAHAGHPLTQLRRGAHRGRGRVVQLVCQVGRQRAELGEVLALPDLRLAVAHAQVQAVEQVHRHREPGAHQVREVLGRQAQEAAGFGRHDRCVVELVRLDVRADRSCVGAAVARVQELHVLTAEAAQQLQATGEQHEQMGRRLALAADDGPLVERAPLAALGDPGELLVAEPLEEEQRTDLVEVERVHESAR
uniref:Uncharacterized protein n=1 Tax=uncultured Nocardioidaceae bacterium TaxID=253824 RepID=A0A6J4KWV1_9ACTN|nr:MAG: hypothetical protein AVDCRST_MAG46-624 [uncultured Nocardioidaceae bacterium]